MTTVWILPGGASFGAIQVGVAAALLDAGRRPDLIIGTSIGAVNAAFLAADPTPSGADRLRRLWLDTRRRDVLSLRAGTFIPGMLGRRNHLFGNQALDGWLRNRIPYELIEDAAVPLTITASDLLRAEPVYLRRGDVVTALLASCAAPGMLPPVQVADRWLVDGWVLANAPVAEAARMGADRIFVLPCGGTQPYRATARRSVLHRLAPDNQTRLRALSSRGLPAGGAAIHQELVAALVARTVRQEFLEWTPRVDIYLPPGPDVRTMSVFSFTEAAGLIATARRLTRDWLPTARPLTPLAVAEPSALSGIDD
jgi:NTE family protein